MVNNWASGVPRLEMLYAWIIFRWDVSINDYVAIILGMDGSLLSLASTRDV